MSEINTWPGWENVKILGAGSYGKVYEIQREEFGKTYKAALKVITIPKSYADIESAYSDGLDEKSVSEYFRSIVKRITEEFALMSELQGYTNIVSYYDHMVIENKNEIGWNILIRMELLTSLQNYCREKALTEAEIIKLGCDICKALDLCWGKKIIHRDIKPENIFVNEHGDFELGDFGIARTVENDLTTGTLAGTESYMAPEVYLGKQYGHTADIYSLGVVLYRYLNNNRIPFLPTGDKIYAGDRENAKIARMKGQPVPEPLNGSDKLKKVVLKALSFRPEDRYQTSLEFMNALLECKSDANVDSVVNSKSDVINKNIGTIGRVDKETEKTEYLFTKDNKEHETEILYENNDISSKKEIGFPQKEKRNKKYIIIGLCSIILLILLIIGILSNNGKKVEDKNTTEITVSDTDGMEIEETKSDEESKEECILKLYADKEKLAVGEKVALFLTNNGDSVKSGFVNWSSSDKKIIDVSNLGVATAYSTGTAIITGEYNSYESSIEITVVDGSNDSFSEDNSIDDIVISNYTDIIYVGDSVPTTLRCGDMILEGISESIKWSTDNTSVAKIGNNSEIIAVSPGNCTLKAEYEGNVATTEITVLEVDANSSASITSDYNKLSIFTMGEDVINLTLGGELPEKYSLYSYYSSDCRLSLSWGAAQDNVAQLTIGDMSYSEKNGYVRVLLFDNSNPNKLLATTRIDVRISK